MNPYGRAIQHGTGNDVHGDEHLLPEHESVRCDYRNCGAEFEREWNEDEKAWEEPDIPHAIVKGNFCSDEHAAQEMYLQATPELQKLMRRLTLAADILQYRNSALDAHLQAWDVDPNLWAAKDAAEDVLKALSPDGGSRDVPGPADDCNALLLPVSAQTKIHVALLNHVSELKYQVVKARQVAESTDSYLSADYRAGALDRAQAALAEAQEALKALEGLEKINA